VRTVDIITRKRDGAALSRDEIAYLINGYTAGGIPGYQMAAWAMAVFFAGMNAEETAFLTEAMLKSGAVMDLSGIPGPFIDKHSTGGVGDKTSLIIAPLIASLGIKDPMMSGRALGHTGGTLDKLDAIPGYRTDLSVHEFRRVLAKAGFAITGQTKDIAPADGLLYALRDVTGTVESIPLITASILSKKIAEGADALVLDVKYGSGAFIKRKNDAEALAQSLVDTGTVMGKRVVAVLTDMDEPLGAMVGNFLEVEESFACLESNGPDDLMDVSLALAARMAALGGKADTVDEGRALCEEALAGGEPRRLFLDNIESQGGNVPLFLSMLGNRRSEWSADIRAARDGYIARIDALKIGRAGAVLGVGRDRAEDAVSPLAGVHFHKKRGCAVTAGDRVMTAYAKDAAALAAALPQLEEAVEYTDEKPEARSLIWKEVTGGCGA
jgi:pyrimidine-nucleoside phosphorylase